MIYLVGVISGAISGIGMVFLIRSSSSNKGIELSKSEIVFFQISAFILITFLLGPLLTYMFSKRFDVQGVDAFINHAFFTTIPVFPLLAIGIWQNKKNWKEYLFYSLLFLSGLCWLLPFIYEWML